MGEVDVGVLGQCREHYHGHGRGLGVLAKAAADVDPAHLRHPDVEEREGWCLLLADCQSLFAVPCEQYLVALVVEERHLQHREHLGLIVG
jgi:hypothetical protein